jgi:hypothetical protein
LLLFCELTDFSSVNGIHAKIHAPLCGAAAAGVLHCMTWTPETFSKVAAALGVTRQAVYKWHKAGAPFHSAAALLTWLDNRERGGVLDNLAHRCPVLRDELERALAYPVFWP